MVLAVVAWPYLFSSSGSLDFVRLRGDRQFNVVVVTLDTTRADRLGAYGFEGVQTPVIDSLAAEGILFRRAYSVTPLTLPSHTSLFSGTYPPHHGVRDNGGFIVPDELTTLAEIYKSSGYETAGFIAAYVLDSRWGLDQGFDTYVDDFDVGGQRFISMGGVQRPANEVAEATPFALRALTAFLNYPIFADFNYQETATGPIMQFRNTADQFTTKVEILDGLTVVVADDPPVLAS